MNGECPKCNAQLRRMDGSPRLSECPACGAHVCGRCHSKVEFQQTEVLVLTGTRNDPGIDRYHCPGCECDIWAPK